jgi:hypothetical protein
VVNPVKKWFARTTRRELEPVSNETVEDADLNLEDIAYTQIAEVLNQRFCRTQNGRTNRRRHFTD